MVSVVYVVGTPACEAGGEGSTPFGHPLEKGKDGRSQKAPGSLGSGAFMRVCSWESSQLPNLADRVRLLALVLDADVARLRKATLL